MTVQTSLAVQTVERIFERLMVVYGRRWTDQYAGIQDNALKASWAYELAGFADRLDAIAWALENLPERAPNVIEFRNLCRAAPEQVLQALPAPKPDPARIAEELAKLGQQREETAKAKAWYGFEWVEKLQARIAAGYEPTHGQARMLKEALRHMPPAARAEQSDRAA
jgi:hypothetical protein